ncbi:hypothetical protein ABIA31_002873 [Catenulispora sp. MAP5-51]
MYSWVDGIGARDVTGAIVLADDLLDRPLLYKASAKVSSGYAGG